MIPSRAEIAAKTTIPQKRPVQNFDPASSIFLAAGQRKMNFRMKERIDKAMRSANIIALVANQA